MTNSTDLRKALLDLGLEDLIPLWELPTSGEVRAVLGPVRVDELAAALVELLREQRIQVWVGPWPKDPEVVDFATAERLLKDEQQYEPNSPADRRARVYYANVDNIRASEEQR